MTAATVSSERRDLLQWATWAVFVAVAVAFAVWATHVLIDVPEHVDGWWAIGGMAAIVPIVAVFVRPLRRIAAPVLRVTVIVGGLLLMVLAVYLVVVVGIGEDVDGTEHRVLGLSMVAATVVVVLAAPVRNRLEDLTASMTGPRRTRPDSVLRNFGARMTRAVPMDELLLQLAETLQATMAPLGAELWTGDDGVLVRTISVPDRGAARIGLNDAELAAVTGARVSGSSWLSMWLPEVLTPFEASEGSHIRVAPITHLGNLLGLIVVGRSAADGAFTADEDGLLTDVARQVGLALYNVNLDSALQESLEELKTKNRMLQESRARIVTAADESRRRIERNLHDGAQQRLVALAVKLQLAKMQTDPDKLGSMLDDLGTDVTETIEEMRELAHGIYPPLLRDAGLGDALKRAAERSSIPVIPDISLDRRFDPTIEAAVYFCCLEAMQNAAKHAGPTAEVVLSVSESDGILRFEVADDGAGFDATSVGGSHGFVNMADRLGAHDGTLGVESTPGAGTTIRGEVPVGQDAVGASDDAPQP